jgi:hypothetical protein
MWSLLIVTLPTEPKAVRQRIWRSLKALGCVALRDGAYLLPMAQAALLEGLAAEVQTHGGNAQVWALAPRDEAQQAQVLTQFDRAAAYVQWHSQAAALQAELPALDETEARRRLRAVAEALQALQRIDYYPGSAAAQADTELQALRLALQAQLAPGEPRARSGPALPRLKLAPYQARRWATRARPWVDRLASAWLIRRFIDPQAVFVWLPAGRQPPRTPRGALGFDYDGARFTHVGSRVTFEVLMASFGLEADPALQRLAALVHFLDAGGIPVPQAAGLAAVLVGLRALHDDDDGLLAAASAVFDALHAVPGDPV